MKTVKNPLQPSPSKTQAHWQNPVLTPLALALLVLALAAACRNAPLDPIKVPGGSGQVPPDSTITIPRDSTGSAPVDSLGTKPTPPIPRDSTITQPGDPVGVFKRVKMSSTASDFQEIWFDANGAPVRYVSQYVSNQGTGQLSRWVHEFQHAPDGRLSRVSVNESSHVTYQYEGNQVIRAEERTMAGYLVATYTYSYSPTNKLIQMDESRVNSRKDYQRIYRYTSRGNLSENALSVRDPNTGQYEAENTTYYQDYDNQKHVENLLATTPFLPSVTFRVNNYRTKIVRHKDGTEISRETCTYGYDDQGQPILKRINGPGGSRTVTYSY